MMGARAQGQLTVRALSTIMSCSHFQGLALGQFQTQHFLLQRQCVPLLWL